jgi:hypothetical protein
MAVRDGATHRAQAALRRELEGLRGSAVRRRAERVLSAAEVDAADDSGPPSAWAPEAVSPPPPLRVQFVCDLSPPQNKQWRRESDPGRPRLGRPREALIEALLGREEEAAEEVATGGFAVSSAPPCFVFCVGESQMQCTAWRRESDPPDLGQVEGRRVVSAAAAAGAALSAELEVQA